MGILDDDFEIKIAAMRAGVADVEFTASKQKYKIAKIEKNNTLLFAFGQKGPLVLTIVSLSRSINKVLRGLSGYIDVGDGCWRPNVLVTSFRCW